MASYPRVQQPSLDALRYLLLNIAQLAGLQRQKIEVPKALLGAAVVGQALGGSGLRVGKTGAVPGSCALRIASH